MNNLNVLLLPFLLASCASTTHFQTYPNLDAPNTPSAVVHVVRPNSAFGAAITARVYVDRFLIGRIGPSGHLKTRVPVGRVHVTSTTADAMLQTEAVRFIFWRFQCLPKCGFMHRTSMSLLSTSAGRGKYLAMILDPHN